MRPLVLTSVDITTRRLKSEQRTSIAASSRSALRPIAGTVPSPASLKLQGDDACLQHALNQPCEDVPESGSTGVCSLIYTTEILAFWMPLPGTGHSEHGRPLSCSCNCNLQLQELYGAHHRNLLNILRQMTKVSPCCFAAWLPKSIISRFRSVGQAAI